MGNELDVQEKETEVKPNDIRLESLSVSEEIVEQEPKGEESAVEVEEIEYTAPVQIEIPQKVERISSRIERQQFWAGKRNPELEKAYSEIAPDIPLVNVEHRDLFIQKCREYFEELVKNAEGVAKIDRWDEYEIIRMFGKGLNPTSLKTALNNINFLAENLQPDGDTVRVVEYGPGSGWSTLMLKNQLQKKFPGKNVEIYSVDMSPHSLVATQNSLDYYQIPWQTEIRDNNVEHISNKEGKVTLVLDDFLSFSKNQPDNYFDGFFSSHGAAYLSEAEYGELLSILKQKGKDNSVFVADSLDPLYTVDLDTLHLVLCSINPKMAMNMKEYVYGKSLVSNSQYFPGQEVKKLTKVNNKESMLFYNWNHFLLSKLKFKYIAQMLKSIKITTDVIEEYREDVYPSYLVNKLVEREDLNNWKSIPGAPECPLYITNCAFVLKK